MKNKIDKTIDNPTSPNYNEKIKNKANEKTPYEEDKPSSHTTYK